MHYRSLSIIYSRIDIWSGQPMLWHGSRRLITGPPDPRGQNCSARPAHVTFDRHISYLTAPLKLRKTESSCLKEIPLQMLPMGMWGLENIKIKKFRWGLFDF